MGQPEQGRHQASLAPSRNVLEPESAGTSALYISGGGDPLVRQAHVMYILRLVVCSTAVVSYTTASSTEFTSL